MELFFKKYTQLQLLDIRRLFLLCNGLQDNDLCQPVFCRSRMDANDQLYDWHWEDSVSPIMTWLGI